VLPTHSACDSDESGKGSGDCPNEKSPSQEEVLQKLESDIITEGVVENQNSLVKIGSWMPVLMKGAAVSNP
jgi:hypothetical protein